VNRHEVPNAILGLPGRPTNGGSRPRFYEFDDGVPRLVKWHPSVHGAKACYNELVASRLGQLFGAPILRGLVVYVADEIIPSDHRAEGAAPGFHFGVTRMQGENFVPSQHYQEIENDSELPFAAVFLAWLSIGDQEGHNQFLQRLEVHQSSGTVQRTMRFRLVDMGQMFGNFRWTAQTLPPVAAGYRLPGHLAEKVNWDKLSPAVASLCSLDEAAIRDCFTAPDEWSIASDDRDAAVNWVLERRALMDGVIRNSNTSIN